MQDYPQGALYVVATPIGNLADITLRALHVLQLADAIACEDTRHSQALLRAYGIDKPGGAWLAVHQHNEAEAAHKVLAALQDGQRVVYVSDAGTPGVSDPGARLVAAVRAAGLRCIPLPGASSVTTAVSVAGCVAHDAQHGGFEFVGFLPTRAAARRDALQQLARQRGCLVLLEAPHRILDLAQQLQAWGGRQVTLARELTKQFEEVATLRCDALHDWLRADARRTRGEFVVVLHPDAAPADGDERAHAAADTLQLLLQELPLKTAVKLAAELTGQPRNVLYEQALQWKKAQGGASDPA